MDPVKIGQADAYMSTDIPTAEDLRVLLRVIWTPKSNEIPFKSPVDLKRGDMVRVTVEKVSEAPKAETEAKCE
jgi:hypothetical protein